MAALAMVTQGAGHGFHRGGRAKRRPFPLVIPAKAGIHFAAFSLAARWIPAFAGMT
jgi:hypothetical protein